MAREPRGELPNGTFHIFSQCHDKQNLLLPEWVQDFFMESIQQSKEKYPFDLYGAEIVGNHFHIFMKPVEGGPGVSRIMQYIKARTAEKYNKATGRRGAFWIGRFKYTVIEESDDPVEYSIRLIWYIAFNPVRKGLSNDPRNNYIGFINCYLKEDYELPSKIKITLHPNFINLGETFSERVDRFLWYEEAYRKRMGLYF